MTRVFPSIESVQAISDNPCSYCGSMEHDYEYSKVSKVNVAGYPVMRRVIHCAACGNLRSDVLYLDRHARNPILNQTERENLKRARRERGMSLKELATYLRLRVSDLSDFERGIGEQPQEVIDEIEQLLQAEILERPVKPDDV